MTDLYRVYISDIQGRCVSISYDGLDSDSSSVGDTKSFYLMLLREAAKKDDAIAQLVSWDDMLNEEWLYRNLNSFIQYVQLGKYEENENREERPYWTCEAKFWVTSKRYVEHLKRGDLFKSRAYDAIHEHVCLGPVWTFDRHVSFPLYFRKRVLYLLFINKIQWHLPKDIFGVIVYWFSQAEQQDYNRNFIPNLTPRQFGFGKTEIPASDFLNIVHKKGVIEADYKGSVPNPYHITFKFDPYGSPYSQPIEYTCTCPAKVTCKHIRSFGDAVKDQAMCVFNKLPGTLDPIGKLFGNVQGVSNDAPNFDYEKPAVEVVEKKRKLEEKVPYKKEPKKKVFSSGTDI